MKLGSLHLILGLALFSFLSVGRSAYAFDVINKRLSYMNSKFVTFGVGLGFTGFAREKGIAGGTGFGFRVAAGHHFNQYLQAEFVYQFSTFNFSSPDPIDPSLSLRTRAIMNQEILRFILLYPAVLAQPFVSVGIGGYNWDGVNQETALSFPINFQIPVSAGVQAYLYKNLISLDAEFSYQFLFGENQPPDTLALLGLNKISFDTYSFMTSFTFHFY